MLDCRIKNNPIVEELVEIMQKKDLTVSRAKIYLQAAAKEINERANLNKIKDINLSLKDTENNDRQRY